MRRQLAILVGATTSLVLIAFLVPLGYLVQQVAADRAVNAATREAEGLAPVVATVDRDVLRLTLDQVAQNDAQDFPLSVFLPDGTVLGEPAQRSVGVNLAARGRSLVASTGGGREVLVAVAGVDGGTAVVRTFVPGDAMREGVGRAWAILGGLAVALLGLSLVVADRLAGALVRPMRELADVSHRLGAGELDARVQPSGPQELRAVGTAVNNLATRIGELLTSERESVADLSHRLRTPLTALRLDAESLRDRHEAARVSRDVDALVRTVDAVIHEARRPVREGIEARCDAAAVVRERLTFWSPLAEEEEREVTGDLVEHPLPVRVSAQDLSSALDALIGNVFAHTPPGTSLAVRITANDDGTLHHDSNPSNSTMGAIVTVSDQGPGFSMSQLPRRGLSAGNSTGLGLDIARRTTEASGGWMEIPETTTGAVVTLILGPAIGEQP